MITLTSRDPSSPGESSVDEPFDDSIDTNTIIEAKNETIREVSHTRTTLSDKLLPTVLQFILSFFAVASLYHYTGQKDLWIIIFTQILLVLYEIKYLVENHFFTVEQINDVDYQGFQRLFFMIRIIVFVLTKLIVDLFNFIINISNMNWYSSTFLFFTVVYFVFIVFDKIAILS